MSGVVGTAVSTVPAVLVLTANGEPAPRVAVTFNVDAGSGSVGNRTAVSGPDGVARVGRWTLGTSPGKEQLTATVTGLPPVVFSATATAGPVAALSFVAGSGQTAAVNTAAEPERGDVTQSADTVSDHRDVGANAAASREPDPEVEYGDDKGTEPKLTSGDKD